MPVIQTNPVFDMPQPSKSLGNNSTTCRHIMRLAILVAIVYPTLTTTVSATQTCKPPPPPPIDLTLTRYYTDKAGTRIDPALKRAKERAVKPLKRFVKLIGLRGDQMIRYANPIDADCGIAWLRTWANAGAYLGDMTTKQAEYQRKWDLAGTSLAYLKLRKYASPAARAQIEPWLKVWAQKSRAFFDNPGRKRNNHWYWLGLGLGAVALATDDDAMWNQSRAIFSDAMRDINPDGTMAMESARKSRALHYHTFAATPLVALAELAAARGEHWYKSDGAALHRLVALIANAHANGPTATPFTSNQKLTKPGYGWLPQYTRRFPNRLTAAPRGVNYAHRWLGGDIRLLHLALKDYK